MNQERQNLLHNSLFRSIISYLVCMFVSYYSGLYFYGILLAFIKFTFDDGLRELKSAKEAARCGKNWRLYILRDDSDYEKNKLYIVQDGCLANFGINILQAVWFPLAMFLPILYEVIILCNP